MTPRRFASINPSLHPHWIPYSPDLSVIVLSGGRSTRMGQDKATLDLEGETLLERTVRAAQVIGPSRIIVAGPEPRGTAPGSTIRGIPFVREDPPYGGVALSIRAALCELDSLPPRTEPKVPGRSQPQGEDWVLVLPVDLYDPCGAALELVGHRHDSMLRPTSTISDGPVDGWIAVTDDAAPESAVFLARRHALEASLNSTEAGRPFLADLRLLPVHGHRTPPWGPSLWARMISPGCYREAVQWVAERALADLWADSTEDLIGHGHDLPPFTCAELEEIYPSWPPSTR